MGADLRYFYIVFYLRLRLRLFFVGGRVGFVKFDISYNRDEKDIIKVKEEKLDKFEILVMEREREKFRLEYLFGVFNLMDRLRFLGGFFLFLFGVDRFFFFFRVCGDFIRRKV